MSRFKIAFAVATEDAEVVGAVFDIEKDIEKEQEINGAAIGDIAEDETQARVEEVLSIEEFENELSAEFTENNRVEEVADNLTDLASVVGQIEEPTATDVALIQTTANMAVAGTEVDAQDVLPAVENFTDMKIVAEGIGEKASAAMASLRESGLAMATKISEYLKKTFTSLKYYERKLIESKAKIAELKASGKKELAVSMRANRFFNSGDTPVKDGADLLKRLNESVSFHDKFSTLFIEAEKSFAGAFMNLAKNVTNDEARSESHSKLMAAFFDNYLVKLTKTQGMTRAPESKAGFDTYINTNLLGNDSVAVRIPSNYKDLAKLDETELRQLISGSYVGIGTTLGIAARARAVVGMTTPLTISVKITDLEGMVRVGEKEVEVLKKYLDKVYQSANRWSKLSGMGTGNTMFVAGQFGGSQTRLIAKGRMALYYTSFWARSYGSNLLDAILKTVDAAVRQGTGGIATEDFSVALEGVGGGIIGVLKTYIPGFGAISASKDRQKAADLTREIQEVAKQIAKLRGEAYKQAHDEGKITDDQYEKDSDANAADVVAWSWKDVKPITSTIRAYKAGSQAQDLSKELKAKLKELEALGGKAE